MPDEENVSEMLVHVSGDLLKSANGLLEMQARLDIVKTAWNMSLNTRAGTKKELKRFMKKQKKLAPSKEALKGLELEVKRVIKQKNSLYPEIVNEIISATANQKEKNDYEITANFKDKDGTVTA
jgi:hypothetical protein